MGKINKAKLIEVMLFQELLKLQERDYFYKASVLHAENKKNREVERDNYKKSLTKKDYKKFSEVKKLFINEGFESFLGGEYYEKDFKFGEILVNTQWQYLPKSNQVKIEHCSCRVGCCGYNFGTYTLDFQKIYRELEEYWTKEN